jgi:hypothetical protein
MKNKKTTDSKNEDKKIFVNDRYDRFKNVLNKKNKYLKWLSNPFSGVEINLFDLT